VLFGGFGGTRAGAGDRGRAEADRSGDVAAMMAYAERVVIVPGYGMAVAQAQHAVGARAELLERGVEVKYAIHPVAGRMPGHMNVLLAEANVPYDAARDGRDQPRVPANTDVALVIGANDVVNPRARRPTRPQPDLRHADPRRRPGEEVIVIKRGMGTGFAGIENALFLTMYSRSSEPVRFERDCAAVLVPQGEAVTLPAGSVGYITQALGGSYTVFVEGNLFRMPAQGRRRHRQGTARAAGTAAGAGDEAVEKLVWKQLRTCFDPEIPINVVDLGLVYEAVVSRARTAAPGRDPHDADRARLRHGRHPRRRRAHQARDDPDRGRGRRRTGVRPAVESQHDVRGGAPRNRECSDAPTPTAPSTTATSRPSAACRCSASTSWSPKARTATSATCSAAWSTAWPANCRRSRRR
jgi:hypothetical protein